MPACHFIHDSFQNEFINTKMSELPLLQDAADAPLDNHENSFFTALGSHNKNKKRRDRIGV
jgi:hypothetical protein